uniref:Retinol dehydrogenase 16 n=1 Tax=Crocodylus porosus TaxID=8502 RepID=A0A7M4EBF7_CROPO
TQVKERSHTLLSPGLWGLVNNAGTSGCIGHNEWLSKADFTRVLDVNLVGLTEVMLSLLPLVQRAQGCIVNVASVGGRLSAYGGGYCISKYGMEAFSNSLRDCGVKVSITDSLEQLWSRVPAEVKEGYGQQYLIRMLPSDNLRLVTDAMEHALTARHPRTRYSCGWDAKLLYLPLSYLPTSWADLVLTCYQPKPAQGS